MSVDLRTTLGPVNLRTPLIAASGTVGSVVDFASVADLTVYGAAVAKSVSGEPWSGRPAPRVAPAGMGMLNAIGIQNPGIEQWRTEVEPSLRGVGVPVWGSAVGHTAEEFAVVARGLEAAGVAAIEVNLSCPNLDGEMIALDARQSERVVEAVRAVTSLPIAAKLSPNAPDIVSIAAACQHHGADWVVLTNTIWGAAIDIESRRPSLASIVGGYSGVPLKPIAMRAVVEVHRSLPQLPIVGCGGVVSGRDVIEYLLAGASAVALGTIHFADPKAGKRILRELVGYCETHRIASISELVGAMRPA
ncbi:MAG TPA: dihydroorotate dehydrogenase [Acidimicrobiia bacterium]|jgi:dihydroorotate dehydrogenase (NAD+) catalytic subunit